MTFRSEILALMRDFQVNSERSVRMRADDEESSSPINGISVNRQFALHLYNYGGTFHMIPENYQFPKCTAQKMWALWHLGNQTLQIGPLKKLRRQYRMDVPSNRRYLIDKAGLVMDAIEVIAKRKNLLIEGEEITSMNCCDVWGPSFREYLTYLYSQETINSPSFRPDELYYTTLHKVHTEKKSGSNGLTRFERNFNAANF